VCQGAEALEAEELVPELLTALEKPESVSEWADASLYALRSLGIDDGQSMVLLTNLQRYSEELQGGIVRLLTAKPRKLSTETTTAIKKKLLILLVARPNTALASEIQSALSRLA
jgi:hypothetical protein